MHGFQNMKNLIIKIIIFIPSQVPITALIANSTGFHLMESEPAEQDFTGVLWALAVPILSATINIITRQVDDSFEEENIAFC